MNLEDWKKMGHDLDKRLRLPTYPLAVKYIGDESEIPAEAVRPSHGAQKWCICQAFTYARRWGWTTAITAEENFCVPASAMHKWIDVSDEDFMASQVLQGWHLDLASEKTRLEFAQKALGEGRAEKAAQYHGLVASPLANTLVAPDTVLIFGDGSHLTHIIHALCYDYKEPVMSAFEGFGESCVKGGLLPFMTGRPQIVIPGMGDRVFAGLGDHELGIGLPAGLLPLVMEKLFQTGGRQNMGQPVKTLLPMGLTESITPGFKFLKEKIKPGPARQGGNRG
ncbi:MAG: DUF169 domain-containing protein [Pseudomonadota bacterium]